MTLYGYFTEFLFLLGYLGLKDAYLFDDLVDGLSDYLNFLVF